MKSNKPNAGGTMRILRLSTLSLTLAIAVFSLGYVNPSFANKPVDGKHDHGGEDKTETVFTVEMQRGTLDETTPGLVTSAGVACGSTAGGLRPGGVGAEFPADCAVTEVFFIIGPTGGPLPLSLWYVTVNLKKSKVDIWFRTFDPAGDPSGVYVVHDLLVEVPDNLSSSFTVPVNLSDLAAEKNHEPGKGDLVGPIAIGEIVYTLSD